MVDDDNFPILVYSPLVDSYQVVSTSPSGHGFVIVKQVFSDPEKAIEEALRRADSFPERTFWVCRVRNGVTEYPQLGDDE